MHCTPATALPKVQTGRLTYPAPSRCHTRTSTENREKTYWTWPSKPKGYGQSDTPEGLLVRAKYEQPVFTSYPYGEADVLRTLAHGGWFDFAVTDFDSPATRQFAQDAQRLFKEVL